MSTALRSPATVAAVGLVALAVAMGIGRFAFTPLLPMMQAQGLLTLIEGSHLAAANYLGYLAGAVACMVLDPRPRRAMQAGLLAVAIATLAMGVTTTLGVWWLWRFAAGIASALVLVGASAWSLSLVAQMGQPRWGGLVFAGVGSGIFAAGLLVWGAEVAGLSARGAWWLLGMVAALAALSFLPLSAEPTTVVQRPASTRTKLVAHARPIVCYGFVGLGYIVPATYLPTIAREASLAGSGAVWSVLGIAAALSTAAAALTLHKLPPRRIWIGAQLLMALGVAAPAISTHFLAMWFCALAVGSSFMVISMAATRDAQDAAGPARAGPLVSALAAAFAAGQVLGPYAVSVWSADQTAGHALKVPSLVAAALLLLGVVLIRDQRDTRATAGPLTHRSTQSHTDTS